MRDIRLQPPAIAVLTGKGRKTRHVPLGGNTAALLDAYLAEHHLTRSGHSDHPLFVSQYDTKLSRGGIAWILRKYQRQASDPALATTDLARTYCAIAKPCTSTREASPCPTSATY